MTFKTLDGKDSGLSQRHLVSKLTPEQIKEHATYLRDKEFIAKIQSGDEVWEYNDIGFLTGSAGLLILRDGAVAAVRIIMRS